MGVTMIELECEFCHKIFDRVKSEHTRNQKYGRRVFCSLSCTARQHNIDYGNLGDVRNFKGKQGPAKDKYSPYRYYRKRIRQRNKVKGRNNTVTLQDLKDLWEKQKGICPYTGWKLILPQGSSAGWENIDNPELKASLDRIDSSKGYVNENIQFVSIMANWAKNELEEDKLLKFCRAVAENNK